VVETTWMMFPRLMTGFNLGNLIARGAEGIGCLLHASVADRNNYDYTNVATLCAYKGTPVDSAACFHGLLTVDVYGDSCFGRPSWARADAHPRIINRITSTRNHRHSTVLGKGVGFPSDFRAIEVDLGCDRNPRIRANIYFGCRWGKQ